MTSVRLAAPDDAAAVGRLLHDFNREYDDPTPDPVTLGARMAELMAADELTVLLAEDPPAGLAVLRFRRAIWTPRLECYLAELYVVPARRGQGLGRALLETAIQTARARGADTMELGTSEDDVAARALYERLGFTNRERPGGPLMYVYEREL